MPHLPLRPVALAATLLLAVACSAPDAPKTPGAAQPKAAAHQGPRDTGDWLVDHLLSDPEQLNPLTSNDATAASVLGHIVETLLDRDPQTLELRPLLAAARPVVSADTLQYTFTLRDGATFSDGRPVTVDDVLFSIKAIKCEHVNAPFTRVYYASIVDAERVGPGQVRFTASEPYFKNEETLGGIGILPRHHYDPDGRLERASVRQLAEGAPAAAGQCKAFAERFNRDFSRNPLGSGPYTFTEWVTGERVVLDRNPAYWGYKFPGVETPYVDRLLLKVINNTAAALVSLKGGDLDTMTLDPMQDLRETSSKRFAEQYSKLSYHAPAYTYIGWNNDHPIFADARVRRAMTMLSDRHGMVDTILHGLGQVVDGPIYRFRPEYDETLEPPPFDPKAAEALLKAAGWADHDGDGVLDREIGGRRVPFVFEIKINSGNEPRKSVALTLQDELKKHGIVAKIRELDWTIFLDAVRKHEFDAIILGWSMSVTPPDAYQVWHSSQIENGGSNHISYRNARVDAILEEYRRTFDPERRTALYREFQHILNDEQPYTFLFMRKVTLAHANRFRDVEALPIGGPVMSRWWVPKAEQKYGAAQSPAP
ncbi:MAG: hypothetical protein HZA24_04240 [Nitrospirae bacterium]|nr:hypothetical protein [Nitrospirota bacterium]